IVDASANALILTCNDADFETVGDLLGAIAPLDSAVATLPLRVIELKSAQPTRVAQILQQVTITGHGGRAAPRGRNWLPTGRSERTLIVPDDNSGILLVRASEEVNAEIDRVVREIDRDAAREFEIRTIVLERANAA